MHHQNDGMPFEMAPISDFTVIEHRPNLPLVWFQDWVVQNPFVTQRIDLTNMKVYVDAKRPYNMDVQLNPIDVKRGWVIIWEDE